MCNGIQNIMAKMIGYDGKYTVNSSTSVHTLEFNKFNKINGVVASG